MKFECPLCGSTNNSSVVGTGTVCRTGLPEVQYTEIFDSCHDCGYEGVFDATQNDTVVLDAIREAERLSLGPMLDSIKKSSAYTTNASIERVTGLRIRTLDAWLRDGPPPGGWALIRLLFLDPTGLDKLDRF